MREKTKFIVISIYDGCYYFQISTESEVYDREDLDNKKEHKLMHLALYIYENEYDYSIEHIRSLISENYEFENIIICDNGCIEIY